MQGSNLWPLVTAACSLPLSQIIVWRCTIQKRIQNAASLTACTRLCIFWPLRGAPGGCSRLNLTLIPRFNCSSRFVLACRLHTRIDRVGLGVYAKTSIALTINTDTIFLRDSYHVCSLIIVIPSTWIIVKGLLYFCHFCLERHALLRFLTLTVFKCPMANNLHLLSSVKSVQYEDFNLKLEIGIIIHPTSPLTIVGNMPKTKRQEKGRDSDLRER